MLGWGRRGTGRRGIAAWKHLSWNLPLRRTGYWIHGSASPHFFFSYRLEIGTLHVVLKHFVGWFPTRVCTLTSSADSLQEEPMSGGSVRQTACKKEMGPLNLTLVILESKHLPST